MNINFEAGLHLINLGSYSQAVKNIQKAIDEEMSAGNEKEAIEYTCVLGDLFANLKQDANAKAEFDKVIEFCERTKSLPKQKQIAENFIGTFNRKNRPNTSQTSPYKQ